MTLRDESPAFLRRRRASLLSQIASVGPHILRGSLIERYLRCGKPGCRCAQGAGHGPKCYLSVSYPDRRPQQDYIPQRLRNQVTQSLANYQKVKSLLEGICDINRELLRRREEL